MILEKQVLSFAKAVEDITALERLGPDDIEAFRERRMLQMRRVAERRPKWCALGTGVCRGPRERVLLRRQGR